MSIACLTTHVLDTVHGGAAEGMRVDLYSIGPDETPKLLTSFVTNHDGRSEKPLLEGAAFAVGRYELAFHVGAYFTALGTVLPKPPFLEIVPVRFGIADTTSHYHVPLLVSPWSFSTYRGN